MPVIACVPLFHVLLLLRRFCKGSTCLKARFLPRNGLIFLCTRKGCWVETQPTIYRPLQVQPLSSLFMLSIYALPCALQRRLDLRRRRPAEVITCGHRAFQRQHAKHILVNRNRKSLQLLQTQLR